MSKVNSLVYWKIQRPMPMSKIASSRYLSFPILTAHKDVIDNMPGHLRGEQIQADRDNHRKDGKQIARNVLF